jgi:hypothetical protein
MRPQKGSLHEALARFLRTLARWAQTAERPLTTAEATDAETLRQETRTKEGEQIERVQDEAGDRSDRDV